jgi:dienelactone hydrolase
MAPQAHSLDITSLNGEKTPAWFNYLKEYDGTREELICTQSLRRSRVNIIHNIIYKEAQKFGDRIILCGTSQGACFALDIATYIPLTAVISIVGLQTYVTRMRPLKCPWFALNANNDSVFAWANNPSEGATEEHRIDGDHWVCDNQVIDFVQHCLDKIIDSSK